MMLYYEKLVCNANRSEPSMGINTKGKRKIAVLGQRFVWFVDGDCGYDTGTPLINVHVVSCDKTFSASYQLNQPDGARFVVIKGKKFAGAGTGQCWKRFLCPRWESSLVVTPDIVRSLIEWCLKDEKQLVEVDWKGETKSKAL